MNVKCRERIKQLEDDKRALVGRLAALDGLTAGEKLQFKLMKLDVIADENVPSRSVRYITACKFLHLDPSNVITRAMDKVIRDAEAKDSTIV